jgi:hypothetical protein
VGKLTILGHGIGRFQREPKAAAIEHHQAQVDPGPLRIIPVGCLRQRPPPVRPLRLPKRHLQREQAAVEHLCLAQAFDPQRHMRDRAHSHVKDATTAEADSRTGMTAHQTAIHLIIDVTSR